jgi:DNA-binding response OmpR family regulator
VDTVLVIDDDIELGEMLQEYLQQDGFLVHAVHTGEAGLSAAMTGKYRIAVLDVMMPGIGGVETLRRLRTQSNMPVLMLTAKGDDADRINGLELGADDYVPKPYTPRELSARIRAILRRTAPLHDGVPVSNELRVGALAMWPEQRRVEWNDIRLELTSTEFNLLELLVRNAGKPVSKAEVSEKVLGRPLGRFDRNIDVHLSSLRRKLGTLSDGRSCIHTVYRQGYQFIWE